MQLYDRGLRRRLPTMLDGDERRIRMGYSLFYSLPGTSVLYYGEEIGMAENLDVEGRLAVRTPMQWEPDPKGGFSRDDPATYPAPFPGGEYGPEHVNVESQRRDPESLLSWIRTLIERYRECPELAWGKHEVLPTGVGSVFAHRCDVGAAPWWRCTTSTTPRSRSSCGSTAWTARTPWSTCSARGPLRCRTPGR